MKKKEFYSPMNITCRCITDIGPRQFQQDCLLAGSHVLQGDYITETFTVKGCNTIFAVCDGLGCFTGSGLMSKFVCNELSEPDQLSSVSEDDIHTLLESIQKRSENSFKSRLGTTIAGIAVGNTKVTVFNAGDSRVYKITQSGLKCISHDHSLVQQLVDSGLITEQEAATHPHKNVVSLGIGSCFAGNFQKDDFFLRVMEHTPGDKYLICSDGVHGNMDEEEIFSILKENPLTNADLLHEKLKQKGLSDNTSLVVVRID